MKKQILWLSAVLLAAGLYAAVPRGNSPTKDEQEIRALEDRFVAAVKAKDVEAIMKGYAPGAELFVFDVVPPRQYVGFDAYEKDWQEFFAGFPGPIDQFELTDLSVTTEGKLGYGHSIQHLIATGKDGSKTDLTVRVTDCYRKIDGKWLITHEHVSVPVDLATAKADLASKP